MWADILCPAWRGTTGERSRGGDEGQESARLDWCFCGAWCSSSCPVLWLFEKEKKKKRKKKQAFPKLKKFILRPQKWGKSSDYQEIDPFEISCWEKSRRFSTGTLISLRGKEILEQCCSQLNRVGFSTSQGKSWPHQRAIFFFLQKNLTSVILDWETQLFVEGKQRVYSSKSAFDGTLFPSHTTQFTHTHRVCIIYNTIYYI